MFKLPKKCLYFIGISLNSSLITWLYDSSNLDSLKFRKFTHFSKWHVLHQSWMTISKSLRPVFIDCEMTQNLFQLSVGCQLLPGYKYQYCKQSIKQSKVKVNKKVCPLLPTPIKCHLVITHQIIIMITRGMILWTLMMFPVLSRVMLYPWYRKLLLTLMLPVLKMTVTMIPVLPIIVYQWMIPRTAHH